MVQFIVDVIYDSHFQTGWNPEVVLPFVTHPAGKTDRQQRTGSQG
jgi:hypothetical protein